MVSRVFLSKLFALFADFEMIDGPKMAKSIIFLQRSSPGAFLSNKERMAPASGQVWKTLNNASAGNTKFHNFCQKFKRKKHLLLTQSQTIKFGKKSRTINLKMNTKILFCRKVIFWYPSGYFNKKFFKDNLYLKFMPFYEKLVKLLKKLWFENSVLRFASGA